MINFNFYVNPDDVKLNLILKELKLMSNDLSVLQVKLDAVKAKAEKLEVDFAALAQKVIDLQASQPADVQAGIDALVVEAQAILDGMNVADPDVVA